MRDFFKKLGSTRPQWLANQHKILSVQLSYARNLQHTPFPNAQNKVSSLEGTKNKTLQILTEKDLLFENNFKLNELTLEERQLLEERLLISNDPNITAALSFNDSENRSILINQHDHFKIKYLCSWEEIEKHYKLINEHDRKIRQHIKFAFDDKLGYLSASAHRLGSGLKISLLLSLSSLSLSDEMTSLQKSAIALGLELKALDSDSEKPLLWLLHNSCSIGQTEEEILDKAKSFCFQLLEAEKRALHELIKSNNPHPHNTYSRAWWSLRASHSITQVEAKNFAERLLCARLDNYADQYSIDQAIDCYFLTQNTHLKAQEQSTNSDQVEKLRLKSFCELIRPQN